MGDRLTSAHLDRAEKRIEWTNDQDSPLDIAKRAIIEVRRLRRIIARTVAPFPQGYEPVDEMGCCLFCGVRRTETEPHNGPCPWPRLVEEAEAIRAEAEQEKP